MKYINGDTITAEILGSRSARTARIEIFNITSFGRRFRVAVRKDRED